MNNQNGSIVQQITLPIANAFLIRGERNILVDTGKPGDAPAILRALAHYGVQPREISLILLTHGHVDHFGSAAAMREATGAPIAVHQADAGFLRAGRNPELATASIEGRLLRQFIPWQAAPLEPDLLIDQMFELAAYGVTAQILATPGHSPGSIALRLPNGELVAGDLVRGGFLGGRVVSHYPNPPFFVENMPQLRRSVAVVLDLPITTVYVGHGGPIAADALRRRVVAGMLGSEAVAGA